MDRLAHILSGMWQEYTRETPARPYLGVVGTGLALAAATGLAWLVSQSRALPAADAVQSLPEWPIVFTLPQGLSWVKADDPERGDVSPDGMRGGVAYRGRGRDQPDAALAVAFAVMPEGTTAAEALHELTGHEAAKREEIRIGPLTGTMIESRRSSGLTTLAAAACSERGLAIAVEYATEDHGSGARLTFRKVCRSIEYKSWSITPRQYEFLFPD